MRYTRIALAAVAAAILALVLDAHAAMNRHGGWYNRAKKGRKMTMEAATYFGTDAVEEFVGVTTTPDGKIVAVGNSWGPTFPTPVQPTVLGPDQLWDVPLYPPGGEKDKKGNPQAPPAINPNRTGFLVFYSDDLTQVDKIVRFGWGLANISASVVAKDGGLVIGGLATRNFRVVAKTAGKLKTLPAPEGEDGYGVIEYEGVVNPGDVYVAKLTPDLTKFQWVWILEGHREAPDKICEGRGGELLFVCHGIKRITGDAESIVTVANQSIHTRRRFMGVSPIDGTWLIGGDHHHGTGREPWRKPRCYLYTPDGEMKASYYDWDGPLVGHDRFRLVSDSALRVGAFLPNGHLVFYAWSDGGNSVMGRNPVDLAKSATGMGMGFSSWGAGVGSFAHIARFNPENYEDCSYMFWASYMQTKPNSIRVQRIRGTKDGSIILIGDSANWLVQTTIDWYRAPNQYLMDIGLGEIDGPVIPRKNGWPTWLGEGGRGSYVTIFTPDMKEMLWSSAIAQCNHTDVAETTRGVAAVATCQSANTDRKQQPRNPLFEGNDVACWPEFITNLTRNAEGTFPHPAKQIWPHLTDELKTQLKAVTGAESKLETDFMVKVYEELNAILIEGKAIYDEAAWKPFTWENAGYTTPIPWITDEQNMLADLKAGTLAEERKPDLNRRLLERAFPKYVFRCPKLNQPPAVKAAQPRFGGGYSDGHIYLLGKPRRRREL